MPDEITVANSSCLIALEAIGRLELLRDLYNDIDVPDAVSHECDGNFSEI
jgi:predicted nucleic acid-binding protein